MVGTYGTLTVNTSTGIYTYTKNSAAIEALNAGENPSDVFTMTVSDGDSPIATQNYTVNLTGANDAPLVADIRFIPNDSTFENGVGTGTIGSFVAYDANGNVIPGLTFAGTASGSLQVASNGTLSATASIGNATTLEFSVTVGGVTENVFFQTGNGNADAGSGALPVPPAPTLLNPMYILFGFNGSDTLNGGGNGDVLYGGGNGSQTDTLNGNGGPDYLVGGAGNDILNGSAGADILRGGQDNDTLDGQGDPGQLDLIDLSDATGALAGASAFTLGAGGSGSYNGGAVGLGTDTYSNMEGVIGGSGNDSLTGNAGNNEIRGGGGTDTISGLGGNDILKGDAGNDTMTGGAGDDIFVLGPTGSDTITDYSNVVGNADIIDVTLLVTTAGGSLNGFVRLTAGGLLQVDANGGGDGFVTVATLTAGVDAQVRYSTGSGTNTLTVFSGAPPIALDLDGDNQVSFLGTDAGAAFDYGGGTVATAWVAGNDGLLVRDANHDGQVSADEIVFATSGSDLDGLARYDSNGDGQLSGDDAGFGDFGVWQDADSDGQVDAGELQSLAAHSIASISLSSDGVGYSAAAGDVNVVGTGSFTRTDGSTGVLADAVFATGDRVTEEARALAASGNNAVLLAAVAAAGLASAAAAAQPADHHGDKGSDTAPQVSPTIAPASLAADSDDGAQQPADIAAGQEAPEAPSSDAHVSSDPTEANHSLIGSESAEPADVSALPQDADAPAAGAAAAAPAMVALPSAAMLAAMFDSQDGSGGDNAPDVQGLVAQALSTGGQGDLIDAVLDAGLSHAGGGEVAVALAASAGPVMPRLAAFTAEHLVMSHLAMAHPDAAPVA